MFVIFIKKLLGNILPDVLVPAIMIISAKIQMKNALYKCLKCNHKYRDELGPTRCPKCGHLYIEWLNYEKWKNTYEKWLTSGPIKPQKDLSV